MTDQTVIDFRFPSKIIIMINICYFPIMKIKIFFLNYS